MQFGLWSVVYVGNIFNEINNDDTDGGNYHDDDGGGRDNADGIVVGMKIMKERAKRRMKKESKSPLYIYIYIYIYIERERERERRREIEIERELKRRRNEEKLRGIYNIDKKFKGEIKKITYKKRKKLFGWCHNIS